ncbi:MAG: type 11 methyltransferase [Candidatus Syntrophoarchaeum butanivorans]|uniref:Type 11 methyltransferase n=1 Tax=Candidatus Syntropharchaeum butanivorans TaxID=1839936 RepID=A0A1F2P7I8_9EURY|nr:MAG: type 11 methyltransferase [Candidatus Syntrophoarchaeum butanivorans]
MSDEYEMELEFTGELGVPGKVSEKNYQRHMGKCAFASRFVKDKIVLDVACGSGYGSNYLAENAVQVWGDINKMALKYAVSHYNRANLNFVRLDGTNLPFPDEYFDVVVSIETIEHIADYRRFLEEIRRVLKIDGIFVGSTINHSLVDILQGRVFWDRRVESPHHTHEFHMKEINELLREYFSNVKLYGQRFYSLREIISKRCSILASNLISRIPCVDKIKRFFIPAPSPSNLHDLPTRYAVKHEIDSFANRAPYSIVWSAI